MGSGLFGLIYVICQIMFVQVRILSIYTCTYLGCTLVSHNSTKTPLKPSTSGWKHGYKNGYNYTASQLPSIEHRSCIEGVVS